MRFFIALGVTLTLALGAVVVLHSGSGRSAAVGTSNAVVETVTHGDAVDLDAVVPQDGLVIVEFYADW